LDVEDDCEADELVALDWLFEPDVDVWAWAAAPLSMANAVAAKSICLIGNLLSDDRSGFSAPTSFFKFGLWCKLAFCRPGFD
jgi:hypothetical protein